MDKKKKEKIMENPPAGGPKPWGQKEHDQFMEESGMTEEEHKAYHDEHGGMHGKNKDKE